jgi:hypothetical protein
VKKGCFPEDGLYVIEPRKELILVETFDQAVREDARPLRSASFARSVMGIGTKTAFSGLGKTPTGELRNVRDEIAIRRK